MTEQRIAAPPSLGRLVARIIDLGYDQPDYTVGDFADEDGKPHPAVWVTLKGNRRLEDVEAHCLIDPLAPHAQRNVHKQERLALRSALAEAVVFVLSNRDALRRDSS